MEKVFELVSATIRLDHSTEFHELHKNILIPILERYGVKTFFLSETFVGGQIGKFFDIYEYPNLDAYQKITDQVRKDPELQDYYKKITNCILGTIEISLLEPMDYSPAR